MSLQGTLATFSIPDVMRLLASTKKSGRLSVEGDQGQGEVFLDAGQVVAATCIGDVTSDEEVTVVLALLRYEDGSFVFEDGATSPAASDPIEVDALIDQAAELAEEWAELEAVIPSSAAWLSLVAELPKDEVEIDRDDWRLIVAVGRGATAAQLATALETDAMGVARAFKDVIEDGLIEVAAEAPEGVAAWAGDVAAATIQLDDTIIDLDADISDEAGEADEIGESDDADEADEAADADDAVVLDTWEPSTFGEGDVEDEAVDDAADEESVSMDDGPTWAPLGGPVDEPDVEEEPYEPYAPPADDGGFDPNALLREIGMSPGGEGADDGFLPSADGGLGGLGAVDEDELHADIDPQDAAEMARQLASLSPEAAKAVAAAATASSEAELHAALDEVVALDSSINRELLMKFLGSVNS